MKKTQSERILNFLRSGKPITPVGALREFGCLRLAARISDLRRGGHKIKSRMVRRGEKAYASYWMA